MSKLLSDGLSHFNIQLADEIIRNEMLFLDELLRWNRSINLTSITRYDDAIEKHLVDSLLLLPHLGQIEKMIDLGSGGGLPGIPLAIAVANLQVVSIDSVGKKINFQRHLKRFLSLDNLYIEQSRAEQLSSSMLDQESFDLVVARAFTSLERLLGYASPWLKPGGRVIAMKGPEGSCELQSVQPIIQQYRFNDPAVFSYKLPFSQAERQLLVLKKMASENYRE